MIRAGLKRLTLKNVALHALHAVRYMPTVEEPRRTMRERIREYCPVEHIPAGLGERNGFGTPDCWISIG